MSLATYRVQLAGTEQVFTCDEQDTVLRAALRAGIPFPYECNVGSCGNCKFELIEGEATPCWPAAPGLSDKDKIKNRMLGCQTRLASNTIIKLRTMDKYKPLHTPVRTNARLVASRAITHDLSEFVFELDAPLPFASGQYALIQMAGVEGARAYSMSNAETSTSSVRTEVGKQKIEFQVRKVPSGAGSAALFDLPIGSTVQIDGAYGMAYLREDVSSAQRDILCIAGGSGLAPMISIARGAFASTALTGRKLHFVYGARTAHDVCGEDMLAALEGWQDRGAYHAVVSNYSDGDTSPSQYQQGFAHDAVDAMFGANLANFEIYFAGPPLMAQSLLKLLIDRKVPMEQVHFDQFY
jgi:toluene monooxygenase electron transfer component